MVVNANRQNEEYDTSDTDDVVFVLALALASVIVIVHQRRPTPLVQYCTKRFTGISICASPRRLYQSISSARYERN